MKNNSHDKENLFDQAKDIFINPNYQSKNDKINKHKTKESEKITFSNFLPDDIINEIDPDENQEKMLNNIDFNMNPFNEDKSDSNSEEYMMVESDIQNNFISDNLNLLNKFQNRKFSNEETEFSHMKKQMSISNPRLPKVPSYPLQLSNLGNIYGFYSQQEQDNNNFANNNGNNFPAFLPNNSFSMNGKRGWVCPNCKNFNYEMRTHCNRCKVQMMYKSPSVQSADYSQTNFINDFTPIPYNNSHTNLTINNLMIKYKPQKQIKGDEGKKKKKPFIEREGDWICLNCKNLNFAFRTFCNRCNLKKIENQK